MDDFFQNIAQQVIEWYSRQETGNTTVMNDPFLFSCLLQGVPARKEIICC
jgi:hypothetical protein